MDTISHPDHYTRGRVECVSLTSGMDFCTGNTAKYVWRWRDKNHPVQDLRKAMWYLDYTISHPGTVHYADSLRHMAWVVANHDLDLDDRVSDRKELAVEKNFWASLLYQQFDRAREYLRLLTRYAEQQEEARA